MFKTIFKNFIVILMAFSLVVSQGRISCAEEIANSKEKSDKETTTTSSTSLQTTIDTAKKNAQDAQNNLNSVNKTINNLSDQQEKLSAQEAEAQEELAAILEEMEALEIQIEEIKADLERTERELKEAIEKKERQYENMKLRIAYMYEQSDTDIVTAILESKSITDMLNQFEYVNSVYDYDRDLLNEYEQTIITIENLKRDLEAEQAELEEVQKAYEAQQAQLETKIAQLEDKLGDIGAALKNAKAQAKAYQKQIADENAKIAAAQAAQAAASSSKATTTSTGESKNPGKRTNISGKEVANYACQFVGNPYVWGGTSLTNGADCSGFVMSVYRNFGISLPHSSYSLQSVGNAVSYDCAQPGDIVCYSGHVAIYIGGGRIVHAKGTGYGIVTDNVLYSSKSVITIRRVL